MTCTDTRHGGYLHAKVGVKKDGTITALTLEAVLNKGAYYSFGAEIFGTLGIMNITPPESAVIASDLAVKSADVYLGFADRFTGTMIISGEVADVTPGSG